MTVLIPRRYWLYGDCEPPPSPPALSKPPSSEAEKPFRLRGWFPRHCAVPLLEDIPGDRLPEEDQSLSEGNESIGRGETVRRRRRLAGDPLPNIPCTPTSNREQRHGVGEAGGRGS